VGKEHLTEDCGEPGCLVCLHRSSLVATYDELPGWMFVLSELASGGCEVVVFDRERRRRLEATGEDAKRMLHDLRLAAMELFRSRGEAADVACRRRRRGSFLA
jgi:hypothetical protein